MTEATLIIPKRIFDLLRLDGEKIAALNDTEFAAVRSELGELGYSVEQLEQARGG